jgi:flagellar protein FlgJ
MVGAEGISLPVTVSPPLPLNPGATVKGGTAARTKEMATELEATFLAMLLKEMRQTLEPDGGLFPGDTGDVQGGLFDLYLSRHLALSGGVGMATALLAQMQATAPKTPTTDALAPRDTHRNVPPASQL